MGLGRNKHKVFCIGLNKTGTTTLESVLADMGFKLGDQPKGELLCHDWYKRDFRKIIKLAKTADAFQDIPFSLPYTFQALDAYFPNASFILTERDSAEQWYDSITRFHSKKWGDGISPPNDDQLKQAKYLYQGFAYDIIHYIFPSPEGDPYHKPTLLNYYKQHNYSVKEYFRDRPDKLLSINVSRDEDYFRLCEFLKKEPTQSGFPWKNKTVDIK